MMLEGMKAIVTGGSLGIGAAIARELAREGADVAINYRMHDTEAKQVVADIEAMGRKGLAVKALARYLQIDKQSILAVGDARADMYMLSEEICGMAGCPGNSRPEVIGAMDFFQHAEGAQTFFI